MSSLKKYHKPGEKSRSNSLVQYLLATAAFLLVVFLAVVIADNFIFPAIILDKEVVSIPEITGMKADQGIKVLEGKGLSYHIAGEQYNPKFPSGTIIRQVPESGSRVKIGRRIYLTISKGKETVPVPYLIGKTLHNANLLLMQKGLVLGDTVWENSDYYMRDTVISQSIRAGQNASYGDTIDVVVSLGSANQIEMPQLIGKSLPEAEKLLADLGLKLGNIEYIKNDGTYLANTIINQFPKYQEMVMQQAEVVLIVISP